MYTNIAQHIQIVFLIEPEISSIVLVLSGLCSFASNVKVETCFESAVVLMLQQSGNESGVGASVWLPVDLSVSMPVE